MIPMAEFSSPLLNPPITLFTKDFLSYGQITHYTVTDLSPVFWENECLLIYVREGIGQLLVNQKNYPIETDTLCVLHSFHVFQFCAEHGMPLKLEIIIYPYSVLSYMDTGRFSANNFLQRLTDIPPCLCLDHTLSRIIQRAFQTYREESEQEDSTSIYIRHCISAQITYRYYRAILNHRNLDGYQPDSLSKKVFESVYFDCYNSLTAKAVAECFGISVRHLNMELRRLCGNPFQSVLQKARINSACAMMLRKGITFRTISKETGFPSESTFYRIFLEVKGCTPQVYQEQMWNVVANRDRQFQSDVLTEVHKYVLENFRFPISLKSCSEALYLPCSTITKTQKAQYGDLSTFPSLLRSVRVEYVKGLLAATTLPIYDIAEEAGFNSVHTLIRIFKQQTGMTPTQFREEHQHG